MNGADLERKWRVRVDAARQRHLESKRAFEAGVEQGGDSSLAGGGEKMSQARQAECSALDEYNRTLRIYTDLILYGKVPEEPGS